MATNYSMSHPASPDDVNGTGWHQQDAGAGRHRRPRSAMPRPVQVERAASPLSSNAVTQFIGAYEMAEAAEHARRARFGRAVVGGVLGFALVKSYQNRRRSQ